MKSAINVVIPGKRGDADVPVDLSLDLANAAAGRIGIQLPQREPVDVDAAELAAALDQLRQFIPAAPEQTPGDAPAEPAAPAAAGA